MKLQIKVRECRQGRLEERIAKINKQASKLNLAAVVCAVTGEEMVALRQGNDSSPAQFEKVMTVDIERETPVINGWNFVAAIDHYNDEDGKPVNFLRTVGGMEVPECYRNNPQTCEHCGINRRRLHTYILKNGEDYKQVGSSCLKDFTGAGFDVEGIGAYVDGFLRLGEGLEEPGEAGSRIDYFRLEDFLPHAVAHVRIDGFVSRRIAYIENRVSTADSVMDSMYVNWMNEPMSHKNWREERKPTDADREMAGKVVEYVKSQIATKNSLTDYEHNLVALVQSGILPHRMIGFAASMIPSYLKWVGEELRRANAPKGESNHFGAVGKREVWGFYCDRVFSTEGMYGTTWIVRLIDKSGNVATWFASSKPELETGKMYRVKGTVKKHDMYQGVKQTLINRCVVVESVERL